MLLVSNKVKYFRKVYLYMDKKLLAMTFAASLLLALPAFVAPVMADNGSSGGGGGGGSSGGGVTCTAIVVWEWGWVSVPYGFFDIWAWLPSPVLTAYCTGGSGPTLD